MGSRTIKISFKRFQRFYCQPNLTNVRWYNFERLRLHCTYISVQSFSSPTSYHGNLLEKVSGLSSSTTEIARGSLSKLYQRAYGPIIMTDFNLSLISLLRFLIRFGARFAMRYFGDFSIAISSLLILGIWSRYHLMPFE